MKIGELNFRIGGMIISADWIVDLHISEGIFEIQYIEDGTPEGVTKTSIVKCHAREVEIVCPYEICEEKINVLGELSREVYCTKRGVV